MNNHGNYISKKDNFLLGVSKKKQEDIKRGHTHLQSGNHKPSKQLNNSSVNVSKFCGNGNQTSE